MTWVVDTCVVLDVFENDPQFGLISAKLPQKLLPGGLAVSPTTMVELSAAFEGDLLEQKRFLELSGISGANWGETNPGTASAQCSMRPIGGTPPLR